MDAVDSVPVGVAARLLGLSDNSVRRMIRAGKLASWRTPGGHRRLDLSDVTAARLALRPSRRAELLGVGAAVEELSVISGPAAPPQLDDVAGIFTGDTAEALADMEFAVLRDPGLRGHAQRLMNEAMDAIIARHKGKPAASGSAVRQRKGRS